MHAQKLHITECPRDAMQGVKGFIPTRDKIRYIQSLMRTGYDVLDFCSFVSPKAVPQMADAEEVAEAMQDMDSNTELLTIIGNVNGAKRAACFPHIRYWGYPHSVSPSFLKRNIQAGTEESLDRIRAIQDMLLPKTELVCYVSMGFGNPYGDFWSPDLVEDCVAELRNLGIRRISLADTVALADPETIRTVFQRLIPAFPDVLFGAHLHTQPHQWKSNLEASLEAGCHRIETALLGLGGCPMAKDDLNGNLPTEHLVAYCRGKNIETGIDFSLFRENLRMASELFHLASQNPDS
jgi:hydroxymethylglutaryl-CoA lyase